MKFTEYLGDCRDESLVEEIFGSISEFSRQVEENGDIFQFGKISIRYDSVKDIHTFYLI